MPSALQELLAEGLSALADEAGASFTCAGQRFVAWPVQAALAAPGRIESSPDHLHYYEAASAGLPDFKTGTVLKSEDGQAHTVAKREPVHPVTGVVRFALHPGRSA